MLDERATATSGHSRGTTDREAERPLVAQSIKQRRSEVQYSADHFWRRETQIADLSSSHTTLRSYSKRVSPPTRYKFRLGILCFQPC